MLANLPAISSYRLITLACWFIVQAPIKCSHRRWHNTVLSFLTWMKQNWNFAFESILITTEHWFMFISIHVTEKLHNFTFSEVYGMNIINPNKRKKQSSFFICTFAVLRIHFFSSSSLSLFSRFHSVHIFIIYLFIAGIDPHTSALVTRMAFTNESK